MNMHPFVLAEKFMEFFLKQNEHVNVEGMLIAGSNSKVKDLQFSSDFDVFIVINIDKRYRGMMIIDGVEVDYIAISIDRLKTDFQFSLRTPRKVLADMLANGIIVRDPKGILREIKDEAMERINDLPALTVNEKMMIRYFLKEHLKTLEININNQFIWQYTFNSIMNYVIEVWCRHNRIPLNPKRVYDILDSVDGKFVELWEKIGNKTDKVAKLFLLKELSSYLMNQMELQFAEEWEIIS